MAENETCVPATMRATRLVHAHAQRPSSSAPLNVNVVHPDERHPHTHMLQKQEQPDSFDLEYGLGIKFDDHDHDHDHELRLDEFTRGDAQPWTHFSPPLPGLATHSQAFGSSVSPEMSETTTTPPSIPPFENVLRGPGIREELMLPFRDDHWTEGKQDETHMSLQFPFSRPAPAPSANTLNTFNPYLAPYSATHFPPQYPSPFQQTSPPPTATSISSSSSGSSTPFPTAAGQGWNVNIYNERARAYNSSPHHHFHAMETCDPRGITAPPEDYAPYTAAYGGLSPARSPSQEPAPLKRVRGRPKRQEAEAYYAAPPRDKDSGGGGGGSFYRTKKRSGPGEEMLGMGWDDVDEKTLEFTSRQDAKPTRTLRRQCYNCRTWRDVSAWRRSIMEAGRIVCNKCGLYEKAHKKSRPLNDRGEFVRPGKHLHKSGGGGGGGGGRVRGRAGVGAGRKEGVVGAGVMRFESEGEGEEGEGEGEGEGGK